MPVAFWNLNDARVEIAGIHELCHNVNPRASVIAHDRKLFIPFQETAINTKILLAVSGGIAAYKSLEIVRLLRKQGAEVRVVMSENAQAFVTPLSFQALSGYPVHTQHLDSEEEMAMGHIELARWADCLLFAPATANRLAKMANGIADDLLSTLYLAARSPVWVAPAMNQAMWLHPATRQNIATLISHDIHIIGPAEGEQACGDIGPGRMSEPDTICQAILESKPSGPLSNLDILITAGPTREPLDPVRYITNRSSGKMGYAIAKAACQLGANVTLVSGPVQQDPPKHVDLHHVETAQDMYERVMAQAPHHHIFISTAAVADYKAQSPASQKLKKDANAIQTLVLEKNPDIVASVAALSLNRPFTVGFAAETEHLETYALHKLHSKNLDMIAANWVGSGEGGFESDQNALDVYWDNGKYCLQLTSKQELAEQLLRIIKEHYDQKNPT
jgi:phosphopantothenoylcysteine decarboxylase / phosphopantothenate---cysteine ligase